MTNQFFYGTLRDPALLAIVLGHKNASLRAATLAEHRVCHAGAEPFPQILAEAGSSAEGFLAENLSASDLERLAFYEGGFGYDLRTVTVETAEGPASAQVWFPQPGLYLLGQPWSLERWQQTYGPVAREAAQEALSYLGTRTPQEVARAWQMLDSRAQARLLAQSAPDCSLSGLSRSDTEELAARRPYAKFFALEERELKFRKFSGDFSDPIDRAVFVGADAALVLPYDPVRDRVLLIEQFRSGPFVRGDAFPWCLEPIAGMIDGGETPEDTARREALEEARLSVSELHLIGRGYASPGDSTGFYHMFLAVADLPDSIVGIGGVETESENIRSHLMQAHEFIAALDAGRINVAPLQLMGHWFARNRESLRARA
jgi:ADP-ribose pyrophosphatase